MRGPLVELSGAEHAAEFLDFGVIGHALDGFEFIGDAGAGLGLAVLEADEGDFDLGDLFRGDVEHAATLLAAAHAAAPGLGAAAAAALLPARPCCASTGTAAKASGSFTLRGLSVLFSISTLPWVESLGMTFTPRSPLAMPSNRSTVVASASAGAAFGNELADRVVRPQQRRQRHPHHHQSGATTAALPREKTMS